MTVGIFFINVPTLNLGENFSEEVERSPEEIISPFVEEISEPEKISKPAQVKPFKLPEIVTPSQKEIVLPNIEPQKYNPPSHKNFSENDLKFPEVTLPAAPNYEPPKKYEPPQKSSSGLLKTEFYLNEILFNQDEHRNDGEEITREEWRRLF